MGPQMKIGLIGSAGAGKDTFADRLVQLGYTKVELKGPLHELLMTASPPYNNANYLLGYEGAKRNCGWVRPLMIDTGEQMKRLFGNDIFARTATKSACGLDNVVVSDVRFAIEAQLLYADGFRFLEIVRPGADAGDAQEAVNYLRSRDLDLPRIDNAGTLEELQAQADQFKPWRDY